LTAFGQGVFAQNTGLEITAGEANLPQTADVSGIIGQIIYAILGFLGVIFVILLIYGGFTRMTAGGNPEAIKKSNGIIVSAVIGIIIILASYTITAFVLNQIRASVGEGGSENYNTCSSINGACYSVSGSAECPEGTHSEGQKDCPAGQACCTTW